MNSSFVWKRSYVDKKLDAGDEINFHQHVATYRSKIEIKVHSGEFFIKRRLTEKFFRQNSLIQPPDLDVDESFSQYWTFQ